MRWIVFWLNTGKVTHQAEFWLFACYNVVSFVTALILIEKFHDSR